MSGASSRAAKISSIHSDVLKMPGARLVTSFSQVLGKELEMLKEMKHGGACRALCIQWIIHRHQGKDFWSAMKDPNVFRQIINQQMSWDRGRKNFPNIKSHDEWIRLALSTAELDIHSTDAVPTNPRIEIEHTYQFHIYRCVWAEKGAHAMAAEFRGPWVNFFDPNVGQFHFDSKTIYESFLNDVLFVKKKYGTKWTLYKLSKREIG